MEENDDIFKENQENEDLISENYDKKLNKKNILKTVYMSISFMLLFCAFGTCSNLVIKINIYIYFTFIIFIIYPTIKGFLNLPKYRLRELRSSKKSI